MWILLRMSLVRFSPSVTVMSQQLFFVFFETEYLKCKIFSLYLNA